MLCPYEGLYWGPYRSHEDLVSVPMINILLVHYPDLENEGFHEFQLGSREETCC
jgi:hypothetical protein